MIARAFFSVTRCEYFVSLSSLIIIKLFNFIYDYLQRYLSRYIDYDNLCYRNQYCSLYIKEISFLVMRILYNEVRPAEEGRGNQRQR